MFCCYEGDITVLAYNNKNVLFSIFSQNWSNANVKCVLHAFDEDGEANSDGLIKRRRLKCK